MTWMNAPPRPPTLVFLDFDGVMHPVRCHVNDHFCNLKLFEEVMREFPDVQIVIASTWREAYLLSDIRQRFSPDIGARIIGKTPTWDDGTDEHIRYREIRQYLGQPKLAGAKWIALDDADFEFPDRCPNLLLCDSNQAFDARVAAELRARLQALD